MGGAGGRRARAEAGSVRLMLWDLRAGCSTAQACCSACVLQESVGHLSRLAGRCWPVRTHNLQPAVAQPIALPTLAFLPPTHYCRFERLLFPTGPAGGPSTFPSQTLPILSPNYPSLHPCQQGATT